jgi:hypothetical protein
VRARAGSQGVGSQERRSVDLLRPSTRRRQKMKLLLDQLAAGRIGPLI